MRIFRYFLISLVIAMVAFAAAQDGQPFRLVFANATLSSVLRAVGLRTGANIVYVGKEDPPVTIDVTAGNADEALRFVTTAASMTYRRVGQTFIVARPEDMRQALEPFGLRFRMTLTNVTSADAASLLRSSLPYLTVQPVGTDQLLLTGTKEDIEAAKDIIASATSSSTSIVPVRLVSPTKVVDVLTDMYPDVRFRAVAQGDAGGSIIITGKEDRVAAAKETLALMDSDNPAPGSEQIFKTYNIRYSNAPVLVRFMGQAMPDVGAIMGPDQYVPPGVKFTPLTSTVSQAVSSGNANGSSNSGSQTNTQITGTPANVAMTKEKDALNNGGTTVNLRLPGETATQIILHGSAARVNQALEMLASVDVKPKQVTVEVKVVDYTPSNSSNVGFNWSWSSFQFNESGGASRPPGFGSFSRVPWSFTSVLQALVKTSEAKILATPSIQVVDNEPADIFIGDTLRVQLSQATGLGTVTQTVQEFPIGIVLLLRPHINADGDVTLYVHPVVSTITSIDANNLPQTSTREAETTLVVKNGETIVLGGLIRDEMTKTVSEVPLLSKLPLVGELFRNTTRTGRKSEILVFITPKIGDGTPASAVRTPGN
jgi:general secretion pathway protein D